MLQVASTDWLLQAAVVEVLVPVVEGALVSVVLAGTVDVVVDEEDEHDVRAQATVKVAMTAGTARRHRRRSLMAGPYPCGRKRWGHPLERGAL